MTTIFEGLTIAIKVSHGESLVIVNSTGSSPPNYSTMSKEIHIRLHRIHHRSFWRYFYAEFLQAALDQ